MVQRVSPIDIGTVPGEIMIDIGTVPAYKSVGVKFYFKRYIPGGQTITVYYTIVYLGGSTGGARYYSSSADWSYINSKNIVTLPFERACALQVKVAGLVSGDYFRVDLFTFAGTYKKGENVTDGSFESGGFGDGYTCRIVYSIQMGGLKWLMYLKRSQSVTLSRLLTGEMAGLWCRG